MADLKLNATIDGAFLQKATDLLNAMSEAEIQFGYKSQILPVKLPSNKGLDDQQFGNSVLQTVLLGLLKLKDSFDKEQVYIDSVKAIPIEKSDLPPEAVK